MKLLLLSFVLFFSFELLASAECAGNLPRNKDFYGEFKFTFDQETELENTILNVQKYNGSFQGNFSYLFKKKKGSFDIYSCEGQCCEGFSEESGLLPIYSEKDVLTSQLPRNTRLMLNFKNIDWVKNEGVGELYNPVSGKSLKFKFSKILRMERR